MSLSDLDSVLDEAVLSYVIAKKRCIVQRNPLSGMSARSLVDEHPGYYVYWGNPKKIKFVGKCAGDVLEDYLQKLGYPRGSDQWFSLAHIVIERGEYESEFIGQAPGDRGGDDSDDGRL